MTLEALGSEIRARFDAIESDQNERLSDQSITRMIDESLKRFIESDSGKEYVRKVRWGGESDPKLHGSKYGRMGLTIADVEMLHDITLAAHKRGMGNGPTEELRNCFTAVSEGRYEDTGLVRSRGEVQLAEMLTRGVLNQQQYTRAMRAMDTAESGYGQQLIGAQYVHELWRGAQAEARIFGLIRKFDMTAPTAYLPVQATLPVVKYVGESTVANAARYASTKTGSNRVQVDARKLLMLQAWSYELDEDSLIPMMEFLREEATRSWAHHMDSILLNGDTTDAATGNINLDDANPDNDLFYLAFDGIRHGGLVDNTNNRKDVAGALTIDEFRAQKGRMLDAPFKHDWSHPNDPNDLVYVADPETADAVSFLDEALTYDKIGDRATMLTGQQARILNHPLIASMDISKTEADGKVSTTAANNVKGQLVTFNRRGYVVGTKSQMQVETDRDVQTQQNFIVWSTRVGFGRFSPTGAASGIESADVLFNISL